MAGISISLITAFLLFYVSTRKTKIKIKKQDRMKIELHLQLIAFEFFIKKSKEQKGKKNKENSKHKRKRIITTVLRVVRKGELHIERLALPYPNTDSLSFTRPFRYRILISSLIAYLETKAKKITLSDNAIILSPDINALQYDLTVTCKLYELIYAVVVLTVGILKEREKSNVRE
ncbi:MAG: hypothetical protein IJX97_01560 [Clostridia bacterium]|nr:hypothetical protein [Clostridia bacterium]